MPANVGTPHLIGKIDCQVPQQIGIFAVLVIRNARPRPAPDGLVPHLATQALQVLAIDFHPVVPLKHRHQPAAAKARVLEIDLIKVAFDPQIRRAFRHRFVSHR